MLLWYSQYQFLNHNSFFDLLYLCGKHLEDLLRFHCSLLTTILDLGRLSSVLCQLSNILNKVWLFRNKIYFCLCEKARRHYLSEFMKNNLSEPLDGIFKVYARCINHFQRGSHSDILHLVSQVWNTFSSSGVVNRMQCVKNRPSFQNMVFCS